MSKILVSGIVNMETSVKVSAFPVEYSATEYQFYGINTVASGGGFNISKALTVLGDQVKLLSAIGNDCNGNTAKYYLKENNIETKYIMESLDETPQSVVLYEDGGTRKRQIFCDLKNIQKEAYDQEVFEKEAKDCSLLVLCNTNFSRPFLSWAKKKKKLIATHVYELTDLYDEYNVEFMKHADILFLNDDYIEGSVYDFVKEIAEEYHNKIIVVGQGAKGAILYSKKDDFIGHFPAVRTRETVSTVGAGDSLFSAFLHFYLKTNDAFHSIKRAILFASYKIGTAGASEGFLTEEKLENFYPLIWK